jgi:hypothetical protein
MDEEDSSLVQESLIENLFIGMNEQKEKEVDPNKARTADVLDLSKMPKIIEPQTIFSKWMNLKRLNITSEKEIQEVLAT